MAAVLNAFSVERLWMPDVTHTTQAFERLLDTIETRGLSIDIAKAGIVLFDYGNLRSEFVAPNNNNYTNLNDWSAVLRIEYGNTSVIIMGDAEHISENEIVQAGHNIQSDILRVGHHGSSTSSTRPFIERVAPRYAIISVGAGNSYGHPTAQTLATLNTMGVEIWRTDERGTITAVSNGINFVLTSTGVVFIQATPSPSTPSPTIQPTPRPSPIPTPQVVTSTGQFIGNRNSQIFHRPTCSTLPAQQNRVYFDNKAAAEAAGYRGCQRCNP
jgi:hypothetical protein